MENLTERIEKLASLHERGLLTDEEFGTAKKLVLGISTQENEKTSKQFSPPDDTKNITSSGDKNCDNDRNIFTEQKGAAISINSVHKNQNINTENQKNLYSALDTEAISQITTFIKEATAFESRLVLDAICKRELQKIKEEKVMWRLGGAIIGGLLGVGDGFDVSDVFLGAAVSQIGAVAYSEASREQVEFLEKVRADWLVTTNSPIDFTRRYGPASSRILVLQENNIHMIFNHHKGGSREECLVPLGLAGEHAKGFLQADTNAVLQSNFDKDNYEILSNQLYPIPNTLLRIDSFRRISNMQAVDCYGSAAELIIKEGGVPYRVEVLDQTDVIFKFPIPPHSDF